MPDAKEVQGEVPPEEPIVTAPAQVEVVPTLVEPAPVTEEPKPEPEPVVTPPEIETPKNEAVPQSEWQKSQERISALERKDSLNALEKFELEYPIVNTEKYKAKWEEKKAQKATKGHKYAGLEYSELLNLIRDNSLPPEPKPAPTPVPSLTPSIAPDAPAGEIPKEVNDMMRQRYTQEEIDGTKEV